MDEYALYGAVYSHSGLFLPLALAYTPCEHHAEVYAVRNGISCGWCQFTERMPLTWQTSGNMIVFRDWEEHLRMIELHHGPDSTDAYSGWMDRGW